MWTDIFVSWASNKPIDTKIRTPALAAAQQKSAPVARRWAPGRVCATNAFIIPHTDPIMGEGERGPTVTGYQYCFIRGALAKGTTTYPRVISLGPDYGHVKKPTAVA